MRPDSFPFIVAVISTFSPLVPLFIYLRTKNLQKRNMRLLGWLLVVAAVADLIGMSTVWITVKHLNIIASNLALVISCVLIILFYQPLFDKKHKKIFFVAAALLFVIISCQVLFYPDDRYAFNGHITMGISVIIVSLLYFFVLLKNMPTVHIQSLPMFWINTGFLLYSSCTLILFIISYYLSYHAKEYFVVFWTFHNSCNIIQYLLFAIGLWQVTKKAN